MPFDKKKIVPINYTSRDFNSIKGDLLSYVKRYYPDNFKDFNEASFGSLMLDTVSYVGDVLSFYLDYSVNESFLETANEYNNILKLSKQMGYKRSGIAISSGIISLYIIVPADLQGTDGIGANSPDFTYAPILLKGTIFESTSGANFTLAEDVNFNSENVTAVPATTRPLDGIPTSYAIKANGQVISGRVQTQTFEVGPYERFPRFRLDGQNIVEIISVYDSSGNRYYEVDYLSQDTIYLPVKNNDIDLSNQVLNSEPLYMLKQFSVPRRFITESDLTGYYIQFGFGSELDTTKEALYDPSKVAMNLHGRDYIKDTSFDPTNLLKTDKLGVAPSDTNLTVVFRVNGPNDVNAASKTITNVINPRFEFDDTSALIPSEMQAVMSSLEFENEEPIIGNTRQDSSDEIKYKAYGMFNSQNRAVTQQDYMSLIYNMPAKFGSIKRAAVLQDINSFKRNLNIYVISEDGQGNLITANSATKNNLKVWLASNKMINDTIDILDAKIINLGLKFSIISDSNFNGFEVLNNASSALKKYFLKTHFNIGEPVRYGDVLRVLKNVDGLLDVVHLKFETKTGSNYSNPIFSVDMMTTADGRIIVAPSDAIFEIKFPDSDIVGTIA